MAQLISTQRFTMQSFAFERGVNFDHHSRDADGGRLTAADAPGLSAPFAYSSALSLWDGAGGIASATRSMTYLGTGLDANGAGTPNSGRVTGLVHESGNTGTYLVGVSARAVDIFAASQTTSRSDDIAILRDMLKGSDRVILSAFSDSIATHDGNDTVHAGAGNDTVYGNAGGDKLYGEAGRDVLFGGFGYDMLSGGLNADRLYGGDGSDRLLGNQGNDRLYGESGGDRLVGGYGDDRMYGGVGADVLIGGEGRDVMFGGADTDRDTFVFGQLSESRPGARQDVVHNFVSGTDRIDLSGLDANGALSGDQAFRFTGTTADANAVWYSTTGSSVIVSADVTGDGISDFSIRVTGLQSLAAADFLL